MEQAMEMTKEPRIKYRTFTYHSELNWTGDTCGHLTSNGKQSVAVSSPPEFQGMSGLWTPEDMFVASAETCTMLTFLAFAKRKNLSILSYSSKAEGILEFVDGGYRFSRITVRPKIQVSDTEAVGVAKKILQEAHRHCFISNSIRTEVEIQADVSFRTEK